MHIVSLHDSVETGYKVQDDETKTQHIVPCNMLVYATVHNKTPARLMNVVLYIR